MELDALDRQLLEELAAHGRLSNMELAQRVPLTHSAISRRIARLEKTGVILGYGATIDPAALGLGIRAFINLRKDPSMPVDQLGRQLRAISGVEHCWIITGEYDIMLDVRATDMPALSDILFKKVQKVKGGQSTVSIFVLDESR